MDFSKYKCTGQQVKLDQFDCYEDGGMDDDDLKKEREKIQKDIAELQEKLCAEASQSLLVVLQAMDAAGKDSTIEKLTDNLNAHGCTVHSFKSPSKRELTQDFLWRVHAVAPQVGEITIFNRSHYEDVLIVKVHNWAAPDKIDRRYQHINNFEELLIDGNTKIVKFMLNISPEYQLKRFQRRLENDEKHWKFNPGDLEERKHWDKYMGAFETVLSRCATEQSPWYVVPAENRRFRDVMIGTIVRDALREMNPEFPEPHFDESLYTAESIAKL